MKRQRFKIEQIVPVLTQSEAGVALALLTWWVGVSVCRWTKQYTGLEVDQVRKPMPLQD